MRKTMRKMLCMMLAAIMLLSICGVAAFAAGEEKSCAPQYKYYTVLGDSIASAYGTRNYDAKLLPGQDICDGNRVDGSYADIVANAVNADVLDMRSHSGWRTYELLKEIGCENLAAVDTMYGAYYNSSFFRRALNYISAEQLAGEGDRIISAIKKADLITLNIGTNDIFSYALTVTANKFSGLFEDSNILEFENMQGIGDLIVAFNTLLCLANKQQYKGILVEFVSAIENGFAMYKKNMPVLIDAIKNINSDAELVIVGMSNPTNITFDLPGDIAIDPYLLSDSLITRANTFTKKLCNEKCCMFVDVIGTDYYGIGALDMEKLLAGDEAVKYSAIKIVHPNEAGHAFMAQQIISALNSGIKPEVTARYSTYIKRNTLNWNPINGAVRYNVYRALSPNGNYRYIGSSTSDIYYDYATLTGVTYYYKVCAVMNSNGGLCTPFSDYVALRAK